MKILYAQKVGENQNANGLIEDFYYLQKTFSSKKTFVPQVYETIEHLASSKETTQAGGQGYKRVHAIMSADGKSRVSSLTIKVTCIMFLNMMILR